MTTTTTKGSIAAVDQLPEDVKHCILSKIPIIRFQHSIYRYYVKKGMIKTAKRFQKNNHLPPIPWNLFDVEKEDIVKFLKFRKSSQRKVTEREVVLEKVLTKSDCRSSVNGTKARLTIPKHGRLRKLMPPISDNGIELEIKDEQGQTFQFLYCYIKNKLTYALQGDWDQYVAQNKLKAGDTIIMERDLGEAYFLKFTRCAVQCDLGDDDEKN
ncbi:hypothetical protein FRX31_019157 [Thalictrum thalictroides]|uniref:TF-B3 domain-containing protein n=1 Tax=Thalictrum thalictroides TaxID=46969 RepID=A0A7J6W4K5_THATH|nr:hypothetical protein FRX31_019157 [Thalictrum thalictroides]